MAMALSGFSEERSGALWREMVASSSRHLQDPYLRAMFSFLLAFGSTSSPVGLESVLDEDIGMSDKVGFCCVHLDDAKLIQFVNQCWETVMTSGDLGGFFLCGGSSSQESVALLQRVVDLRGLLHLYFGRSNSLKQNLVRFVPYATDTL